MQLISTNEKDELAVLDHAFSGFHFPISSKFMIAMLS